MSGTGKVLFHYCPTCKKNFKGVKCPRCGKKGNPVEEIPFERDYSMDPTYLDHILKGKADNNKEE